MSTSAMIDVLYTRFAQLPENHEDAQRPDQRLLRITDLWDEECLVASTLADAQRKTEYFHEAPDLVISCNGEAFYCHKTLLCSKSRWFQAACRGILEKSFTTQIINLDDDKPHAVDALLSSFYRRQPIDYFASDMFPLEHIWDVFAIADKYGDTKLRDYTLMEMWERFLDPVLIRWNVFENTDVIVYFLGWVEVVWNSNISAAGALKHKLTLELARVLEDIRELEATRELFEQNPDLLHAIEQYEFRR